MRFSVGDITVALVGTSRIAEKLGDIMGYVQTENSDVDLVFEFVDELPGRGPQPYVSLDNYEISLDRLRVKEKLFCYELYLSEHPARVLVSLRRTDLARKVQKAVTKSWRYFHTHGGRAHLHYLKRFIFYLYMPLVELILLKNNSSFAHCSAIEKQGRAVLFPAWGGVGKTSIMSRYLDEGWRFLSDDSCVIDANGTASIHPLPMHIYKYHEIQSSPLVTRMLLRSSRADRLLWRFLSRIKKPDKLVRWVGADTVFGSDKISTSGKISAVVHIHRYIQCDEFILEKVPPVKVAGLMGSTILDEINNLANISIIAHSCEPMDFIPDIAALHKCIVDTYSDAFTQADCYTIAIPERATAQDIYSFIQDNNLLEQLPV